MASIQDMYGSDIIRVKAEDGNKACQNLNGVEKINDFGNMQELRMLPNCDPQEILSVIMSKTRVRSFDIVKPSLHDIFIRIAGTEAKESVHA